MHIVVFASAEGKPSYHQTESLEEAVKFVEHLTNSEGVSNAKVYRMTEVALEVKAVYRVEVAGTAATPTDGSIRDVPFPAA
jgi:hypothetical protein